MTQQIPEYRDPQWVANAIREDNEGKSSPWSARAEFPSEGEAASAKAQMEKLPARVWIDVKPAQLVVEFEPQHVHPVANWIVNFNGTLMNRNPRVPPLGERIL